MSFEYLKFLFGTDENRLLKHAQKFDISERMLKDSIQQIRSWFDLQPHMPKIHLDERFVTRMLTSNLYSIEKSKTKIENLFTAKSVMPEFFQNRDTLGPVVTHSKNLAEWIIIPKSEKYRVVIFRFNDEGVDEFDVVTTNSVGLMGAEMRLYHETNFNTVAILDLGKMQFGHAIKITLPSMMKCLFLYQQCYSAKLTNIHAVNVPSYGVFVVNIIKSVVKKKLADRIFLHESVKSLHEHVDLDYLPNELGGSAGPYDDIAEMYYTCLQSDEWRKRLMESEYERTDESKRLESTKEKFDSHLGIDGSFRRLDID